MKLSDGIKLIGKPAEIPDCSRDEWPQFLVERGGKVGAEIGVFKGRFSEKFCRAGLKLYAIDPWVGYSGAGRSERKQSKQDANYQSAVWRLSRYKNCSIIRKTSMEAVWQFDEESLDFVYIDGDHRFMYVAQDLYEWHRRVKSGGIVAGHDYFCTKPGASNVICQVKLVVDAFVKAYKIGNFYTFGTDKALSWMFIKSEGK